MRTRVASAKTASVSPTPNIRKKDTCAPDSAAKEMAMMSAAAVITRAVPASPSATLSSLSAAACLLASQYSRIRDTRNTS